MVVDDSPVAREFLVRLLGSDPGIRVVATAHDGEQAIETITRQRPDVITMDIHMPRMNGLDATRRIMQTNPTPIVVVSGSTDPKQLATTFEAMEAGALAVLRRPTGFGHPDHDATARELVQTVKLMAEVKVVRRWPRARRDAAAPAMPTRLERVPLRCRVVAIGASTGGPPVLKTILSRLPADFPVPVLLVQHIAAGFVRGFVEWLAQSARVSVRVAVHGEPVLPGHVYMADDELQMTVARNGRIALTQDLPENGLRPSVSCLFRSVAEVYGGDAIAGLLTGMGRDGADELRQLRNKGALTFAQDAASSVVHGMPGEAIRLDAATLVLSPDRIADLLVQLANDAR